MSDQGFWNRAGKTALNAVTLGATAKVEAVQHALAEADRSYRASLDHIEKLKARLTSLASSRGEANRDAHSNLGEVIAVLIAFGNAKGFEIRTWSDQPHPPVARMQKTVVDFNVALELLAGFGAGVATSAGAWAAVSVLGGASTGTAIAGLSGGAASHAALAWFGGGSLATGGGGMALGSVVLGGLVAAPLIGVTAWLAHRVADKKVKELEPMVEKMNAEKTRLDRVAEVIESECQRVEFSVLQTRRLASQLKETLETLRRNVHSLEVTGVALAEAMSAPGFDFLALQSNE